MKLKYALQKFQVDGISDSRSPGYRKLDRLIRKLKSKQRLRAGARIEFVLVFVIVVWSSQGCLIPIILSTFLQLETSKHVSPIMKKKEKQFAHWKEKVTMQGSRPNKLSNLLEGPRRGEYIFYLSYWFIGFVFCRAEANSKKYLAAVKEKNAEKKINKQVRKQLQTALQTVSRFAKKADSIQALKRSVNDLEDANARREIEHKK